MKRFLIVFGILSVILACSNVLISQSGASSTEVEIRSAICEIENKNFAAAVSTLEGILKKEPSNIYALRLLPGAMAGQIKEGDKSPANLAQIIKAIAAYDSAAMNPVFNAEREAISRYIISLYGKIGGEERVSALLKRAEDKNESLSYRAAFYVSLAADNNTCANNISDVAPVKSTVRRNGVAVYVFRKPQSVTAFNKLKKCAADGVNLINKAIVLNPESEIVWSYQASLYNQLARIAEMEGKPSEQAEYKKKYEVARDTFQQLAEKERAKRVKEEDEQRRQYEIEDQKRSSSEAKEAELKEYAEELKSYRREVPLAEAVKQLYIPSDLASLVSPDDPTKSPAPIEERKQRKEWKIFTAKSGFSAVLPGKVDYILSVSNNIYTAEGNALSFYILENISERDLSEAEQEATLNMMAWILTRYISNIFLGGLGWNNRFESSLVKKDKFNSHSARFYVYSMNSCKEKNKGMMLYVAGQRKSYSISIQGTSDESDERVRRFMKSLKLD